MAERAGEDRLELSRVMADHTAAALLTKEVPVTTRYRTRRSVRYQATLSCEGRVGEGAVMDCSVPGCQVETQWPLTRGQSLQLRIQIDRQTAIRVDLGVVRWVRGAKAGIEFIRMTADDQHRLKTHTGFAPRRAPVHTSWRESVVCTGVTGR